MKASRKPDDVLLAIDALLVVLRESTQRNQVTLRRAQTVRRLRSHGRTYEEILRRVSGASTQGVSRPNLDGLIRASDRLQKAEAIALQDEGVAVADIAVLCGITSERTVELLASRG